MEDRIADGKPKREWLIAVGGFGSMLAVPLSFLLWRFGPDDQFHAKDLATFIMALGALAFPILYIVHLHKNARGLREQLQKRELEEAKKVHEVETDLNLKHQGELLRLQSEKAALQEEKNLRIQRLVEAEAQKEVSLQDLEQARIKNRRAHLQAFHMMMHRVRDIAHDEVPKLDRHDPSSSNDLFGRLATSVLNDTRELFLAYFRSIGIDLGGDIAVTLKLRFDRSDLEALCPHIEKADIEARLGTSEYGLITFARDVHTLHRHKPAREVQHRIYSEDANTAFRRIMNEGWERAVYANDDLMAAFRDGKYQNQNSDWEENYNSTIAVAVRYKSHNGKTDANYGFLCIDSKNVDSKKHPKYSLYKNDESFQIASHSADLLALILFGVGLYRRTENPPPPTTKKKGARKK